MTSVISVFIDEAGDPGTRDGLQYVAGRHEWFCIAAFVVRKSREADVVQWVREIREKAAARQGGSLHYARITRERREAACELLSCKPARAFCVASHKSNLRSYQNPRLGRFRRSDHYYNWCVRLLLERVTAWTGRWHREHGIEKGPLEVVFANRGGHDYDHLFAYIDRLRMQVRTQTLHLKSGGLEAPFLERDHWRVEKAESLAGLQLADMIASSVYQAANINSPVWDPAPATALKPIFATDAGGNIANTGLTVWPLSHQAPLPEASQAFFAQFGHAW